MIAAYLKVNGEIASTQLSVGGEEKCIAKEANNEVNKMLLQSDEILSRILHSRLHSMLFCHVSSFNTSRSVAEIRFDFRHRTQRVLALIGYKNRVLCVAIKI